MIEMEQSILITLLVGFLLGIKHAIEPDHVIAVTAIASQNKSIGRSSLMGVFWGLGHTLTLLFVGMLLMGTKQAIPEKWAVSLEFLVGVMLVYLGISALRRLHKKDTGPIREGSYYARSVFIGMVHGLAGSAAMVVLTLATVQTLWQAMTYILVFGAGTIIGMLVFTTCLGVPFVYAKRSIGLHQFFSKATAWLSTAYGFYYMYELGI